jgi:hypothetical protein
MGCSVTFPYMYTMCKKSNQGNLYIHPLEQLPFFVLETFKILSAGYSEMY